MENNTSNSPVIEERIKNDKQLVLEALKETPIIEPLDKPEGPYDTETKSTKLYAIVGLLLGTFIGIIVVSWKIISNYLGDELNKAIEKAAKPKEQLEPIK